MPNPHLRALGLSQVGRRALDKPMLRSACEDCHIHRMEVTRLIMEEGNLNESLARAKRSQNLALLQTIYEQLERLAQSRMDAHLAFRLHRAFHSRAHRDLSKSDVLLS